jgi:hypothetical protein
MKRVRKKTATPTASRPASLSAWHPREVEAPEVCYRFTEGDQVAIDLIVPHVYTSQQARDALVRAVRTRFAEDTVDPTLVIPAAAGITMASAEMAGKVMRGAAAAKPKRNRKRTAPA